MNDTVTLSKYTVVLLLVCLVALSATAVCSLVVSLKKPLFIDVIVEDNPVVFHTVAWLPNIDSATFNTCVLNLENKAAEPIDISISVSMWNSSVVEIAEGHLTENIIPGFKEVYVALTWVNGATIDDIAGARIMVS